MPNTIRDGEELPPTSRRMARATLLGRQHWPHSLGSRRHLKENTFFAPKSAHPCPAIIGPKAGSKSGNRVAGAAPAWRAL